MEKQPNVKIPVIFLNNYHGDLITNKHIRMLANSICSTKRSVIMEVNSIIGTCDPFVLENFHGTHKMWCVGDDNNSKVYYATSDDGICWTKHGVVLDLSTNVDICNPSVFEDSNNTYKMWYTGSDDSHWKIYYATSDDGVCWTKCGIVANLEVNR